jgi:EAL domain-containing protein (putative c-di-GMP-specific phosphodiesterase class I)
VRKDDTLARLGGDEFAILLENCSLQNAERIANKVCRTVQDYRFVWQDQVFTVGVSIGLTQINDSGETLSEVMRRADAACYAAKEAGRNRVQVFQHGDEGLAHRHNQMQWVSRLNAALDLGNFELWAQEIGEINHAHDTWSRTAGSHFEVLLRLRTPDGVLVQPGDFLPAAERYDLAPKIDRWVLRKLFEWLGANPERCKLISLCAINVSGQTLNDITFQHEVIEMLESSQLPPARLCFEVTETSAIANLGSTSAFMQRLKQHGCTFALDDFGRGLSSFAYLKSLPVDFVKIDGFFVKDILSDPVDRAMVKAIIDMGHALGKKTIAEFVENQAILAELIELGIDYVQGYGIAKPVQLS